MSDINTIHELQSIIIFGIGSFFLYLVVPVALFANEVRLAKQSDDTSGTAAIFNSIIQAFFYIVAWSVFVSIIVFLVIKVGHKGEANPAVGIDRFWNYTWIDVPSDDKTVSNGAELVVKNFEHETDNIQKQAKLLVLIISWAKAVELLLLGVLMALTLKLSMSLPLMKMRRADHYKMTSRIDIGSMMSLFMTAIMGWVLFMAILNFEDILLTSLLEAGKEQVESKGAHYINRPPEVVMTKDLSRLLQMGMKKLDP